MFLFIFCIIVLYALSFFSGKKDLEIFGKEKVIPLKGISAILIVVHHLSFQTHWLSTFYSWGAPIVSIFLFISGYGLMKSYRSKGEVYLSAFVLNRIVKSLLLPFALAWLLYRIINYNSAPDIPTALGDLLVNGHTLLPFSWYVFAILLFYLSFYAVCKILSRRVKSTILILFCIVVGYIALTKHLGYERCWHISSLAFPFGILYAEYEMKFHRFWSTSIIRYYLTVPVCLLLIALCVFTKNETAYMLVYVLIPFTIACLFSKVNVERLNESGPVRVISGISYEIYLCQGISMSLLRGNYLSIHSDMLYILFTLLLTILLAYGIKKLKLLSIH